MNSISKQTKTDHKQSTIPVIPLRMNGNKGERYSNESGQTDASSWLFFDWDHPTNDEEVEHDSSQEVDHVSELLGLKIESKIVLDTKPVCAVWMKRKNALRYSNPSHSHENLDHNGFIIPKMNTGPEKLSSIKEEEWTNF